MSLRTSACVLPQKLHIVMFVGLAIYTTTDDLSIPPGISFRDTTT